MPSSRFVRDRRRALQAVGGTLAAAVVAPRSLAGAESPQHATHAHAGGAAVTAPASPAAQLPRVLDEHERKTLAAIGEQLVPGSTAAGVPDLVDRVLAVEPANELRRFRNALGAFEREARARHSRTWLALNDEERGAVLNEAAGTAPAVAPVPGWKPGEPVLRAPAPGPPPPPTLRDHIDYLRDTVAQTYFATETGLKEIGWDGNEIFEALPACGSSANGR